MTIISTVVHETPRVLEDTNYQAIMEFSRNPDSLNDAWRKVKQDFGTVQFDGTNPSLKDLAKLSAISTFIQQLVIGASSQGVNS